MAFPRFPLMPGFMHVPHSASFYMPNPALISGGPRYMGQPIRRAPIPAEKPPQTKTFVGNIHEKCSNDLIRAVLQECGNVLSWKRVQGANGKFQAFGFCEFEHPESTFRALRILHDMKLGDKNLVVTIDEKTRNLLREFMSMRRQKEGKAALNRDEELPVDDDMILFDRKTKDAILKLIKIEAPELVTEDGEIASRSPTLHGKGGNLDVANLDRDKKEYIRDEIERFRQTYKEEDEAQKSVKSTQKSSGRSPNRRGRSRSRRDRNRKRSRSREKSRESSDKRSRRTRTPSNNSSSDAHRSSSEDSISSRDSSVPERRKRTGKFRSPSRDRFSEDSDDIRERKYIEREMREKEIAYQARLRKWEGRERRQAKNYEKREQSEKRQKRDQQKEAKKLKEFLEDYDDERDDPKYYKSSSLFQRKREYEREREADTKDRLKEQTEIEELKRQVMAEGQIENADAEALKRHLEQEETLLKKMRADSGSPSPHCPLGQKPNMGGQAGSDESSSADSPSESEGENKVKVNGQVAKMKADGWVKVGTVAETVSTAGPSGQTPCSATASPAEKKPNRLSSVFGEDVDGEDEYDYMKNPKKKLVPFEITQEDRIQAMTPEERKKTIKELIEKIPTDKDELFAFPIDWSFVDESLVERRVKPWVTKKIIEYLGEEEPTLIEFICQKVNSKTTPTDILDDISMVLDEEAEVFVVKMWRLLLYESEAKKLGLVKTN